MSNLALVYIQQILSRHGRRTVTLGFPLLQGLEARKAQQYKWGEVAAQIGVKGLGS